MLVTRVNEMLLHLVKSRIMAFKNLVSANVVKKKLADEVIKQSRTSVLYDWYVTDCELFNVVLARRVNQNANCDHSRFQLSVKKASFKFILDFACLKIPFR